MEGYSVTEAASVLGVPTERVWELLARGILSGAPDGETGMRVFLQPRPAPAPAPAEVHARTDPSRAEPERELSPFRELLTEFRNLTERYGQALLALGEARGEVAALRSRVDLLEARMDLRLPSGAVPSPAMPWLGRHAASESAARPEAPPTPEPADEEPPSLEPHPIGVGEEADLDARGRRRRSPHRRATDGFAEALARAEDPSLRDLPGAAEAADALAALREQSRAAEIEPEAALPRDLPAADAVPVAEESEPELASIEIETDVAREAPPDAAVEATSSASEERRITEAAALQQAAAAAVESRGSVAVEPKVDGWMPEPVPDAAAQGPVTAPSEPIRPEPIEPEPVPSEQPAAGGREQSGAPEPHAAEPPIAETEGPPEAGAPAVEAEPEPSVPDEPIEWDQARYTTSLGEPDWYAADDLPLTQPASPADAAPAAEDARIAAEPAIPEAVDSRTAEEGPGASTDTTAREEHLLWYGREREPHEPSTDARASADEGAEEMEMAGTASPRPDGGTTRLPGAWDLEDALAALDAMAGRKRDQRETPAERPQDRPREHVGPASRAYRRLRRILPG